MSYPNPQRDHYWPCRDCGADLTQLIDPPRHLDGAYLCHTCAEFFDTCRVCRGRGEVGHELTSLGLCHDCYERIEDAWFVACEMEAA